MITCNPENIFTSIPEFQNASVKAARAIHDVVLQREDARRIADVLHGTWLEHPLHPALTDLVVGSWVLGSVLDGVGLVRPSRRTNRAADLLISIGNVAALPTAMAGIADFSTTPKNSIPVAASHALLNVGGLLMNLVSACHRHTGRRGSARCLTATASSLLLVSAWLGGKLVYNRKVGVNKIPEVKGGKEWTAAGSENELQENTPKRVEIDGSPVMICRCVDGIHAIGAVCGHEAGPLDKGKVEGTQVTCPWHQSVYDMRNGRVVHGPTTYSEPVYDTRVQEGNVEVRFRP